MTWPRATRNLKHADAGLLAAMQDAAAVLLGYERHVSPDVITTLCQIREKTEAELKARDGQPAPAPGHRPAPRAAGQLDAMPRRPRILRGAISPRGTSRILAICGVLVTIRPKCRE
jgi:hypothetical protein